MQRAIAYLRYVLEAKGVHKAHSPYLYELFDEVLNDEKHYYIFDKIERQRSRLLQDTRLIEVEDLGAGSKRLKGSTRRIAEIARVSAKKPKYARALCRLAMHSGAKQVLELGTSVGLTTAYLASSGAEVISVEGASSLADEAREVVKGCGLQATIIHSSFDAYLSELEPTKQFDLIFIDGHHIGEALLDYFDRLRPHLSTTGIAVIDDIHWSNDMHRAWKQLITDESFELSLDLFEMGWLIRRDGMHKQHNRLRY